MADHIHQEVLVEADPSLVYAVLTDSKRFGQMTGAPAAIDPTPGGAFSFFGGMIEGRNLECLPRERLVQAWRAKTWAPGVYSTVRFELLAEGAATRIVLDHAGFPEGQAEHLASGWHANYWEPMQKLLG